MTYEEYINSDTWKNRRLKILKRDGFKCQNCGSPIQLEVHHLRYPSVYGEEPDDDLITLCDNCHRSLHAADAVRKQMQREPWWERRNRWVNKEKYRDFVYGGSENMCNLETIKTSMYDHGVTNGAEELRYTLGYAHWLVVQQLSAAGYSAYDIEQMTPLNQSTIARYLGVHRPRELNWRFIIPVWEIHRAVEQYVNAVLEVKL